MHVMGRGRRTGGGIPLWMMFSGYVLSSWILNLIYLEPHMHYLIAESWLNGERREARQSGGMESRE